MVIPITLAMLPWVGGKQALFKTIIKRFPSDYRRRTYVEVFGGGGTMLLNKDRSVKEVFNDANGNLINLYRVVRQQPEELMRRLTYVLNSKADFLLTKEQIKLGQYRDPVQWAADYYQLIKQSYAGKGSTFGGNGRSMWAAFPLIDAICARLQYVVIENADFGKVIPANDSPNTIRPLAKLGKAVKIADSSNQRKAKRETTPAVAIAFRENAKPFDKADSVFNLDTFP